MVRNSVSNLFQLNTHKSRLSLSTLIDEKFNENNNVALIQEPPLNRKGEVTGYPFPLSCLYSTNYPRAAIVHNPSLEIWQLPQLSDRDCQTAIWRNGKQKPIINYPEVPINIEKAISEARKMKYDVILGLDSNAHHPLWGSPVANQRGEILENFLNNVDLRTLNDGNATFKRINCETHIDITAITPSLNYKIKSWSVVEEEMFSDHLCLHTVLNPTAKYKRKILNHKKTDWDQYRTILEQNDWPNLVINSVDDIEEGVTRLSNCIIEAAKATTPVIYLTGHHKKEKWWTEDLRQLRRDLRSIRHNVLTDNTLIPEYLELKTQYRKAVRNAKKESWNNFLNKCSSISDASKLARILTKDKSRPTGLTTTPDGAATWNSIDSTKNIMLSLFPDAKTKLTPQPAPITSDHDYDYVSNHNFKPNPINTDDWITTDTIVNIISQLKPSKAPGPDGITARMLKNLPIKVINHLSTIFHNIIIYSFVPAQWCISKAIFIPKNNNTPKTDPKAYRPICLSNVLFKILEKLIQNYLERK